eukprot:467430-Amphidinium_carterae.1
MDGQRVRDMEFSIGFGGCGDSSKSLRDCSLLLQGVLQSYERVQPSDWFIRACAGILPPGSMLVGSVVLVQDQ